MSGSAHTPGPWSVYPNDQIIIINEAGSSLGEMSPGDPYITPATARANALLAAAAPDYDAAARKVEELLAFHEGSARPRDGAGEPVVWINGEDLAEMLAVLRAAIAKAEGRS